MIHEEWMDTSIAKVGDLVHGDYIADMMNALPPVRIGASCSQSGEPWTHASDDSGRYRPAFLTWRLYEFHGNAWSHDSTWEFCGACFAGDTVNRYRQFEQE